MREMNPFVKMMQDITKSQTALVNSSLLNSIKPLLDSASGVNYLKSVLPNASVLSTVSQVNHFKHFSPEISLITQTYNIKSFEKLISPYMQVFSSVIPYAKMAPVFPEMNSLSKAFAMNQMKAIEPAIISMSNIISFIQTKPLFPEISVINNLIKKSGSSIITYNDIISVSLITKLNQSSNEDILSTAVEVNANYEEAKKDRLSFEFFINLFLTLSLFTYDKYSSDKDKNEIINSIKGSETKILNELKNITDFQIPSQYYVIIRQSYAYNCPSTYKSKIKTIFYPNQKVRIIEKRGKWIHVEYFNYLKNQHEEAWCKKKYSKLIKMQ